MKMSGGFVWVVCSFGARLAVDSGLEPGHFLSQNCHLERRKDFYWKSVQLPPSFDEPELHSPPQHLSSGSHSPSPRKLPSEQSGSPSVSSPLVTCSHASQFNKLKTALSHLLAAIVFLVLDSQYLSSFFSEATNCFALFLIIGCGLSSSMSKARALGSKSAPGTVARARSCHFSLQSNCWLEEKIPLVQTQSQLPASSASPPSLSPALLALTLCRESRGFALEHSVSLCLSVVIGQLVDMRWRTHLWRQWLKAWWWDSRRHGAEKQSSSCLVRHSWAPQAQDWSPPLPPPPPQLLAPQAKEWIG